MYANERNFRTLDDTPPPPPVYVAPITPVPPTPFVPNPIVSTPPPSLSALPEYVSVPDTRFEQALIDRGYDVELIINNDPDLRNYKVSTEKIEDELGFKSNYTISDSIDEILYNIDESYDFNKDIYYNINVFKKIAQIIILLFDLLKDVILHDEGKILKF